LPLTITFQKLFDGDNLPKENGPIVDAISRYLAADDYELPVDEQKLRTAGLARHVNTLIYRCPNCQTWEGLKVVLPDRTNQVQCTSCFSLWRLTPTHRLIPLDASGRPIGQRVRLDEVYQTIKAFPLDPIQSSVPLRLQPDESLLLSSRRHILRKEEVFPRIRDLAVGRLYLTNRRLIFQNGERIILQSQIEELKGLSAEAGNRFNFVFEREMYNITFRNESILKWFDTIHRVQEQRKAD
jgi:hypothetical protein